MKVTSSNSFINTQGATQPIGGVPTTNGASQPIGGTQPIGGVPVTNGASQPIGGVGGNLDIKA